MTAQKKLPKIELPGKPSYIKLAEDQNFFELFRKIEKRYDNCFLFESLGEESQISRHHIMGFDPALILCAEDLHTLSVRDTATGQITHYPCENPYYALREMVPQNIISRSA
jgi:anthranilate synthase component 1